MSSANRNGNRVTARDIAQELGVAVSTVGRALSDSARISEEMRARVRAKARELGYVPHSGARAMRLGTSTLIGLIVPDVENEFYGTVAKSLAECFRARGFHLILAVTEDDPDEELDQVRSLVEMRAAGLVIVPCPVPRRETRALEATLAVVELIRRTEPVEHPWFGLDDRAALASATDHLLALGHRRIAYIGGSPELSTGRARLDGFRGAFAARRLAPPDDLVRTGRPRPRFSAEAFEELWRAPDRPTAVVTAGARLAVGVMDAIGRLGIAVPHELSVVGFGDTPWFRWAGLTTLSLPVRDISHGCGEYLLRTIEAARRGESPARRAPHTVSHGSELIVRRSTAAPRGGRARRAG